MMGLGAFPDLSLADARGLRADYLSLLANGIDQQIQAEPQRKSSKSLWTVFLRLSLNWFQFKSKSVTPDYAKDIWRSLEKDVLPALGEIPREHIVPLSLQALEILDVMKPISAHREHVFSRRNDPKQPMNSQTANAALKRIGYGGKLVAHGLRSIASTVLNEAGFNPDVIEAALAHSDKNEVRRAYNRSTYLEQRIDLMNWWGEYVHNRHRLMQAI